MDDIKPFHHYYYGFAILNFGIQPSEFWQLLPEEWWLLYEDFCIIKGVKKISNVDVKKMKELFDSPEARPSIRRKDHGNNS